MLQFDNHEHLQFHSINRVTEFEPTSKKN